MCWAYDEGRGGGGFEIKDEEQVTGSSDLGWGKAEGGPGGAWGLAGGTSGEEQE